MTRDGVAMVAKASAATTDDFRLPLLPALSPRQGLVLDFKKPVSLNFITVAAADGLQRCLVEYAATNGTFLKLQDVGGPEGCPELFRLEFPKTEVAQLRVTLDYTGVAGQCHFRRVIAGLDSTGRPTSSRMIDLSRTFHVTDVAELGMDRFMLDTPQEYFSRQEVDGVPHFVTTKGLKYEDVPDPAACLVATIVIPEDGLYALEGLCFLPDGKPREARLRGMLTRTDEEKGGQEFALNRAASRKQIPISQFSLNRGASRKQIPISGTFGVVKLLPDTDGDGRMDKATVFATNLPPAYGLVPARGGVIVACAPHILFFADRDGDGVAEVRETLFTGFGTGELERGINARFSVFVTHAEDAARRAADRLLQPCRAYQSRRVLPAHAAVLRGVG